MLGDAYAQFISSRTGYAADKPFYMGEFGDGSGSGAYYAASTDTYGRGLYVISAAVNAFKAGASGMSYWPLHDEYYYINTSGGDNGGLMSMGLIGFKKDGEWKPRPSYYAWGLVCNYVPHNSQVYNINGENGSIIDAVAVKSDSDYSVLLVNRSGAAQTVNLHSALFDSDMNIYIYEEGKLPTDGNMIAASGSVKSVGGVYTVEIPAAAACVLSNIGMEKPQPDVTTDETSKTDETDKDTVANTSDDTSAETTVETTVGMSATETDGKITDSNNTANESDETTSVKDNNGCGSTLSGIALFTTAALAGITIKKRKSKK